MLVIPCESLHFEQKQGSGWLQLPERKIATRDRDAGGERVNVRRLDRQVEELLVRLQQVVPVVDGARPRERRRVELIVQLAEDARVGGVPQQALRHLRRIQHVRGAAVVQVATARLAQVGGTEEQALVGEAQ
eukprot:gene3615-biopygen13413